MNRLKKWILLLPLVLLILPVQAQFLRRSGTRIVNESGTEVLLRGMGLGGWMLQEPYMMEMTGIAMAQWQIREKIRSLIGEENTRSFYDAWHDNHCTRRDIDSLAAWGFNSVRLPMHYNLYTLPVEEEPVPGEQTWLEKGFRLTDSLIRWCADNRMYVILDMHAAPGGQGKDYAICDGNPAKPSLWESEANRQKLIALWKKLAERYAHEPWVGGYDIINEPNWSFTTGGNQNGCSESANTPLRQLMISITSAIRQVDSKHLIIIEGNCWGNNYGGIFPVWDNNMAVSFHKYWSYNDIGSIMNFINIRNNENVPVWLGESGENSNAWFTDAIRLVESKGIGWAWWPLKKIGSVVGPMTIRKTPEYQTLLDYWNDGGTPPSPVFATYTLMQMASNAKNQYCLFHRDVIDAMFRQVTDSTAIPFKDHHIPGVIQSTDYDLGRYNSAWYDTDIADYHVSSGSYTAWNTGYSYRNEGVDIQATTDTEPASNGFQVGWTADKEWLQYTARVDSTAVYTLQIRYAGNAGAKIWLTVDGAALTSAYAVPSSGGNSSWKTMEFKDIVLYKGIHQFRIRFINGGINLGLMRFTMTKGGTDIPFRAIAGETIRENETIALSLNKTFMVPSGSPEGFSCKVNGQPVNLLSITTDPLNLRQLLLVPESSLVKTDKILLSYAGTSVSATDSTLLEPFTDLPVQNNIPVYLPVPGKVEAESFSTNNGFQMELCTDAGGGQYAGYADPGDYLDYRITVPKPGLYNFDIRIASLNTAGRLQILQLDENMAVLHSVIQSIPVTGGWQTWQSTYTEMTLRQGKSTLRLRILDAGFNLNWIKLTDKSQGTGHRQIPELRLWPNPAGEQITVEYEHLSRKPGSVNLRSPEGQLIRRIDLATDEPISRIFVGDLPKGFYFVELWNEGIIARNKLIKL